MKWPANVRRVAIVGKCTLLGGAMNKFFNILAQNTGQTAAQIQQVIEKYPFALPMFLQYRIENKLIL